MPSGLHQVAAGSCTEQTAAEATRMLPRWIDLSFDEYGLSHPMFTRTP